VITAAEWRNRHARAHTNVLFWFVNRRKLSRDTFVAHLFLPNTISFVLYLESDDYTITSAAPRCRHRHSVADRRCNKNCNRLSSFRPTAEPAAHIESIELSSLINRTDRIAETQSSAFRSSKEESALFTFRSPHSSPGSNTKREREERRGRESERK